MATTSLTDKDPARRSKHFGPYRATKLWNELLRAFRTGMPSRRQRRHMKSYDECFSASEAVSWLLNHLRNNPNYGPTVTRGQAVQLLDKFHKWHVFEDVRGYPKNSDAFSDGGRLFRFIHEPAPQTPAKPRGLTPGRVPLATRTALMNGADASPELTRAAKKPLTNGVVAKPVIAANDFVAKLNEESSKDPENQQQPMNNHIEHKSQPQAPKLKPVPRAKVMKPEVEPKAGEEFADVSIGADELTDSEVQQVWKTMLLNRLQAVLRVKSLADVLRTDDVTAVDVIHNMTHINKNGVVTNIKEQDQLPQWVLRAMRYLAYWPESVEDVPRYDGFVRDVFNAITDDYFSQLPEPLCSYAMYDVFTSVLACLEEQEPVRMPPAPTPARHLPSHVTNKEQPHYSSLESLMADLTVNAIGTPSNRASVSGSSSGGYGNANVHSPVKTKDIMIVHDSELMSRTSMPDIVQTCTKARHLSQDSQRKSWESSQSSSQGSSTHGSQNTARGLNRSSGAGSQDTYRTQNGNRNRNSSNNNTNRKLGHYNSAVSLSGQQRYETSFGINTPTPKTRLVSQKSTGDLRPGINRHNSYAQDATVYKSMVDVRNLHTDSNYRSEKYPQGPVNVQRRETNSMSGEGQQRGVGFARGSWSDPRRSVALPVTADQYDTHKGRNSSDNGYSPYGTSSNPGGFRSSISPQNEEIHNNRGGKTSNNRLRKYVSASSITSDVFVPPNSEITGPLFTDEERQHLGLSANHHDNVQGHVDDDSRYPSGGYRPRTCPLNGAYRSSSKLTELMVNSVSQVPPPYIPPPRYMGEQQQNPSTSSNSQSSKSVRKSNSAYHNTYSPPHLSSNGSSSGSVTSTLSPEFQGSGRHSRTLPRGSESVFYSSNRSSSRLESSGNTHGGMKVVDRMNMANTHRNVKQGSHQSQNLSEKNKPSQAFMDRVKEYNEANRGNFADQSRRSLSSDRLSSRSYSERSTSGGKGRCQLTESYLMATDREQTMRTPKGKSLFSTSAPLSRAQSSPNLSVGKSRMLEALQLCTLMLPPASRRTLHLLLRFMNKLINNSQLVIDRTTTTRDLVLTTFTRSILRSSQDTELNAMMSSQIVTFMVDHYGDLMTVPTDLRQAIRDKLTDLTKAKDMPRQFFRQGFAQGVTYCQQVSLREYEQQRDTGAHAQLITLLDSIVNNTSMGSKDKKKWLKQFQRAHPDVYQRRFPNHSKSESELSKLRPKIKPPLLSRPLQRLKSLRL